MTTTSSSFFIVGCGRSGTTLLRTMLNHHPQVAIPLESLFIADYLRAQPGELRYLMWLMPREFEIREWGLAPEAVHTADVKTPAELIIRLHETYASHHAKRVWGQKTPRLVRHWRTLDRAFPETRFIHLVRDPRAVAASMTASDVHRSTPYHGALRWRRDVSFGLELERAVPERTLRVTYEQLVSDPVRSLQMMCEFLDLSYDEAMLSFHESGRDEYGRYYNSIHARLSEPPNKASLMAWRETLTPDQVAVVESVCGEVMAEVGYEVDHSVSKLGQVGKMVWHLRRAVRFPGQLLHYLRFRRGYLWSVARRRLVLGAGALRGVRDVRTIRDGGS